MTWFGLLYNGKLLGFRYESNGDAEFANSTACVLDDYGNNLWLVSSRFVADCAARTSIEWYNAGYESPENPYAGKVKVVEVKISLDK